MEDAKTVRRLYRRKMKAEAMSLADVVAAVLGVDRCCDLVNIKAVREPLKRYLAAREAAGFPPPEPLPPDVDDGAIQSAEDQKAVLADQQESAGRAPLDQKLVSQD